MVFLWVLVSWVVLYWVIRFIIMLLRDDLTPSPTELVQTFIGPASMWRWIGVIALVMLFHGAWMALCEWYLHLYERGIFLDNCYDPADPSSRSDGWGTYRIEPCPPERPYATLVALGLPPVGLILAATLPLLVFRMPIRERDEALAWLFVSLVLFIISIALMVRLY